MRLLEPLPPPLNPPPSAPSLLLTLMLFSTKGIVAASSGNTPGDGSKAYRAHLYGCLIHLLEHTQGRGDVRHDGAGSSGTGQGDGDGLLPASSSFASPTSLVKVQFASRPGPLPWFRLVRFGRGEPIKFGLVSCNSDLFEIGHSFDAVQSSPARCGTVRCGAVPSIFACVTRGGRGGFSFVTTSTGRLALDSRVTARQPKTTLVFGVSLRPEYLLSIVGRNAAWRRWRSCNTCSRSSYGQLLYTVVACFTQAHW